MHPQTVRLDAIIQRPPFSEVFPINPELRDRLAVDMASAGFDPAQPVHLWDRPLEKVLVDGHTRCAAARLAGLGEVKAFVHHFAHEGEALLYAIANQKNRRNLTPGEIARCIEALDEKGDHGGDTRSTNVPRGTLVPSAERTAEAVGVSPRTVKRHRVVMEKAPEELKEQVRAGEVSIKRAYEAVKAEGGPLRKSPVTPQPPKVAAPGVAPAGRVSLSPELWDALHAFAEAALAHRLARRGRRRRTWRTPGGCTWCRQHEALVRYLNAEGRLVPGINAPTAGNDQAPAVRP